MDMYKLNVVNRALNDLWRQLSLADSRYMLCYQIWQKDKAESNRKQRDNVRRERDAIQEVLLSVSASV